MTEYLVMNAEAADAVRGESTPGHSLMPLPLTDGRFVLPVAVLNAPEHASKAEYLQANTTVEDIDPSLFYRPVSRRPQR